MATTSQVPLRWDGTRLHILDQTLLPAREEVLVLEGAAKRGCPPGQEGRVQTVHASGSGDDAIVEAVAAQTDAMRDAVVVTADRGLRMRVEHAGGSCVGPSWLLGRL